jgi:uncharacterized protein (DUF1330 family)
MAYYFYANIRITNPDEYQKYLDKVDVVFSKFNGKYLAVDNSPGLLEGKWDYSKSVLIKFENRQNFEKWYQSDDYQAILKHRLSAADCDSILIEGIE